MDPGSQVKEDPRRSLPAVDRLVGALREAAPGLPAWALGTSARRVLDAARQTLAAGAGEAPKLEALVRAAREEAEGLARPRPARVVNATGVVLHTNLGRAPLAAAAAEAAAQAASRYTDLELALSEGRRGDRIGAVCEMLRLLSGAGSALVVNNNAAAVLLVANTFAREREVVVSRGELVEIGGSFRVPEILERAGARLVEVGTTNRTHPEDYRRAIGPRTALLLKVHRSNFEQRGFVAEVGLEALAAIACEHDLPLVEDLGSGTLVDLRGQGLPEDSFVPARLALGASIVCFSGDKLLGGPQAGIVLGDSEAVAALRSNPLARALRQGKLDLAALDWTLRALLEDRGEAEIPVLRALLEPPASVAARAQSLAERLGRAAAGHVSVGVEASRAPVGGGSLPGLELASHAVTLRVPAGPEVLARALRAARVPVLARVQHDAVLLDLRTLLPGDEGVLEEALLAAIA
ncbi:MAG: L-seryl-tRNA(Sec) selenium transferase [Myxococcota bacterium]